MMTRRGFGGVLLGGAAIATLGGCGKRETFRYKMTVEVETPAGIKSAFAVRQINHSTPGSGPALGESKPQWSVKGEAVAVDVAPEKTLFALLVGANGEADYAGRYLDFLLKEQGKKQGGVLDLYPAKPALRAPQVTDMLPMLVTFRDVNDPSSVVKVNPDDLAASFGQGYRLKSIIAQVTDELVTTGQISRFSWWSAYKDKQLNGSRYNDSIEFSNSLNRMDFSRGAVDE